MDLPPDSERDFEARRLALSAVALATLEDARTVPDEKRRICAIFVFEQDDEQARQVALAVAREWGKPLTLPPSQPGAYALFCPHHYLVHYLRRAGLEVPDAVDPGPGMTWAVLLVGGRCHRGALIADEDEVAREKALMTKLKALPREVFAALDALAREAMNLPDDVRRRTEAMVVCECNDPRACGVVAALARERGEDVQPLPDRAASFIHPHADVARIARGLGYAFEEVPEPAVGRMRTFVFAAGQVIAADVEIESEAAVLGKERSEREAGQAFARRILDEKQHVIRRAVALLLADPVRRIEQIVVVFGSPSSTARRVYRELAALPGQRGFPPDLPPGVPVVAVSYDAFMQSVRRGGVEVLGIDAAKLGPNDVRAAIFTPGGIDIQRVESTPLGRSGSA